MSGCRLHRQLAKRDPFPGYWVLQTIVTKTFFFYSDILTPLTWKPLTVSECPCTHGGPKVDDYWVFGRLEQLLLKTLRCMRKPCNEKPNKTKNRKEQNDGNSGPLILTKHLMEGFWDKTTTKTTTLSSSSSTASTTTKQKQQQQ